MMKYFVLIFLICGGCNKKCIDKKFQAKFQKEIQRLELLKLHGVSIDNSIDSINIASETIFAITGVKPRIHQGYTIFYIQKEFDKDTSEFNRWYIDNKCKANEAFFDSAKNRIKSNYKAQ